MIFQDSTDFRCFFLWLFFLLVKFQTTWSRFMNWEVCFFFLLKFFVFVFARGCVLSLEGDRKRERERKNPIMGIGRPAFHLLHFTFLPFKILGAHACERTHTHTQHISQITGSWTQTALSAMWALSALTTTSLVGPKNVFSFFFFSLFIFFPHTVDHGIGLP